MKKTLFTIGIVFVIVLGILFVAFPHASPAGEKLDFLSGVDIPKYPYAYDLVDIVTAYSLRSEWVGQSLTPYSYTPQEYPPLGVLFISLPRLVADSLENYVVSYMALAVATYLAFIVVMYRLVRALNRPRWVMFFFLLPSFLFFSLSRYDIFVALLVSLAILCMVKKRFFWAMTWIGMAMLVKWYPLLLIPFMAAYALRGGAPKQHIQKGIILAVGIFGGVTVFTLFQSGLDALFPYAFHTSRGIEELALYISFLKLLSVFGIHEIQRGIMSVVGLGILGLQLLPFAYGTLSFSDVKKRLFTFDAFIRFSAAAVLFFVTVGKIYSPQWELWWLPLVALVAFQNRRMIWYILLLDGLNYLMFPVVYRMQGPGTFAMDVVILAHAFIAFILIRDLLAPMFKKNNIQATDNQPKEVNP